MASDFPTSLQDLDATRGSGSDALSSPSHADHHALEDSTIEALEAKVGIDNSADTSSLDYKLKSTSSVDPGHKHTAASVDLDLSDLGDTDISSPADGNGLVFDAASGKWKNASTSTADASTTVKGVSKLSVAPVSSTNPIAVGDNDGRVPTQNENDALVGTSGSSVSSSNKLVDQLGLQRAQEIYAADSVGTDSYAITLSPAPTAYVAGMSVHFKAGTTNTGAASLNVNSLGAKTIKRKGGTLDLQDGDIQSGQVVHVVYDGTNFQLMSPSANATIFSSASQSQVSTSGTSETTIASFTLPGGSLGTANVLQVQFPFSINKQGGSSGTYSCAIKLKYGSTTLGTVTFSTTTASNITVSGLITALLGANAATNAQSLNAGVLADANWGAPDKVLVTGSATEDSTADKTFAITMTITVGSATTATGTGNGYVASMLK